MESRLFLLIILILPFGIYAYTDKGTWQVGDCILAQFNMNITIPMEKNASTQIIRVPAHAVVDPKSQCGDEKAIDQSLVLTWTDISENDTKLEREITIAFRKNATNNYYGVKRFAGMFRMAKWQVNHTDYNSTVTVDSKDYNNLWFHTPLDMSFSCMEWGEENKLLSSLEYKPLPHLRIFLPNATVHTSMLKFDAFRVKETQPTGFRTPLDCDYPTNDIVPIAVGVALAVLIIVVLVAYAVGRRRNRQHGYESV